MKIHDISQTENQLIAGLPQKYEPYFKHAQFAVDFMDSFIKSITSKGQFFMAFFALVHKHFILAFLSAIRLHHVQANFDFRYATEAGTWAAFALANGEIGKYADSKQNGILETTQKHRKDMYNWLEKHYSLGNDSKEKFKGTLQFSAHANIADAFRNTDTSQLKVGNIRTSFFDRPEDHIVKTDLWTVGNLAMGLLDLFYGVNRDHKAIEFREDFLDKITQLKQENDRLKEELKNHPRLKGYAE